MKKMIPVLISLFVVGSAYSQEVLKSIENKKTKESITAFCDEYEQDICKKVSLKYINPKTQTEKVLFSISEEELAESEVKLQEVIHGMESQQMMDSKYKVFATYRKVCQMSDRDTNNVSCAIRTFLAGALFVAGGVIPAGAGFAVGTASGTLILGGTAFANSGRSVLQMFLYYPALATDIVRLVTVYPIKKLISTIRNRTLKRKIIPVLEEMSHELENPAKLSELENERLYESEGDRVIELKNSQFKRILKFLVPDMSKSKVK